MVFELTDKNVLDSVLIQGRTRRTALGVTFDWSASKLEIVAKCSGGDVFISFTACTDTMIGLGEPYNRLHFTCFVDGVRMPERFTFFGGDNSPKTCRMKIASVEPGIHTIEFVRQTESCFGYVDLMSFELDGELLEATERDRLIEFVGDSITAGMANLGNPPVLDPESGYPFDQDATYAFSYLTMEKLCADYRIVAKSGIAIHYGYDDRIDNNMANIYGLESVYRSETEPVETEREADVLIIALGTNDIWSETVPSIEALADKLTALVRQIHEYHPLADVVLIDGGIIDRHNEAVRLAYEALGGEDEGYFLCHMPSGLQGGSDMHPSVAEHREMAEILTNFLLENRLV